MSDSIDPDRLASLDSLPSDDAIIEYVNDCDTPPTAKDVARAFKLPMELRAPLRRKLKFLAESGVLARHANRKIAAPDQLPEVCVLIARKIDRDGTILAVPDGEIGGPAPNIRIVPDRRSGRAPREGQMVLARLRRVSGDRYEGRIIRVLESAPQRLFGTVTAGRGQFILQSAARGGRDVIALQTNGDVPCSEGDLVEAEMLRRRGHMGKTARVIANLGPSDSPGAFSALALAEFDIPHVFPEEVIAETDGMKVPDVLERSDLRDLSFVTIDGADARDFDDAVLAEPLENGGWKIRVAIADVAHYVRPDSSLDNEARRRGNSVYLPDRVVPMLPEALSNDLCSLRPHEPRAAFVAEMVFDAGGNMNDCHFERALIRSAARLTYDQVQDVYEGTSNADDLGIDARILSNLFEAWSALDRARQAREPLALNLKERRVILDDAGVPVGISQRSQSESQRLIEDFMIAANVAAAQTLIGASRPCVFRVHDQPDPEKTDGVRDLASAVGTKLSKGQVLRPHHFNAVLAHVRDTADEKMVNEAVLRSQAKAIYSIENIGHFGLSLRNYAHFTSPIRRYADLMVHRALIDTLTRGKPAEDGLGRAQPTDLADICQHISETEARAAGAERRTIDRFAAALFAGQAGKVVSGVIAAVTGSGAFISLNDGAADGYMPSRTLPDDYYVLDQNGMRMHGRHNGVSFGVGDTVDVLVVDVTPVNGGILLSYVDGGVKGRKMSGKLNGRKPNPGGNRRGPAGRFKSSKPKAGKSKSASGRRKR